MIPLLFTLSLSLHAQELAPSVSSPTVSLLDRQRVDAIDQQVTELTSGKPQITGLPTFKQGIKFNDGTTQTTAASTGQRGPTVYSSTLALNNGVLNDWNLVGVSSFTGASSVYVYGLASTTTYRGECWIYNFTAGTLALQISGDTGANYKWHSWGQQGTNAFSHNSSASDTSGVLSYTTLAIADKTAFRLRFLSLGTVEMMDKKTVVSSEIQYEYDASNNITSGKNYISHTGAAALSSIRIFKSAGTITGRCIWEQFYKTL